MDSSTRLDSPGQSWLPRWTLQHAIAGVFSGCWCPLPGRPRSLARRERGRVFPPGQPANYPQLGSRRPDRLPACLPTDRADSRTWEWRAAVLPAGRPARAYAQHALGAGRQAPAILPAKLRQSESNNRQQIRGLPVPSCVMNSADIAAGHSGDNCRAHKKLRRRKKNNSGAFFTGGLFLFSNSVLCVPVFLRACVLGGKKPFI